MPVDHPRPLVPTGPPPPPPRPRFTGPVAVIGLLSVWFLGLVLSATNMALGHGGLVALAVFVWLLLAGAAAAVVVLVRPRPGRRVSIAVGVVVLAAVLCAAPASVFSTIGVDHSPGGRVPPGVRGVGLPR